MGDAERPEGEKVNESMSTISKAAVAGVWPASLGEAMITEAWPSVSATAPGRWLGLMYRLPIPFGALIFGTLTLPFVLAVFAWTRLWRYTLTTQHVRIRWGPRGTDRGAVALSDLEDVQIVRRPGQAFYRAADLQLICGGQVALTLRGVPNPEQFRQNILAARDALIEVTACLQAQAAAS